MATNAFMAGFNLRKNKTGDDSQTPGTGASGARGKASGGGIPGLISGAIQKRQQTKQQTKRSQSTLRGAQSPSDVSTTTPDLSSATIPSFKKGGRVKRTGLAFVHRGERVIPAKRSRTKRSSKRTVTKP
jgi:hypothetical protein